VGGTYVTLSFQRIQKVAQQTKFDAGVVEKVVHLMNLLEAIERHPVLRGKFALKGGTALNLFVFPLPRLSVDIDLNLVEFLSRDELEARRPIFEQAFEAVFRREHFAIRKSPTEHAGGKWRLGYASVLGGSSNIEVDVNYVLRIPLWEPEVRHSVHLGEYSATSVRVLSEPELAAGKLSALFARVQARDLFDAHQLLTQRAIDEDQLRVAFVVYGGFNRVDWRTVTLTRINLNPTDVERMLLPTIRTDIVEASGGSGAWIERMISETCEKLSRFLPLGKADRNFLDALLDRGEIRAELLTNNVALQERIRLHPMLNWKALNVRRYHGL
jgi:predicted nucleotidyltransferase component of viral defense system